MKDSEATSAKASLDQLKKQFVSASPGIVDYIARWKADVDALNNGSRNITHQAVAGSSETTLPVCAVAQLPGGPSTNDEAIVTDANALTNGSTVAGSGSNRVLVRWNGSNWLIV